MRSRHLFRHASDRLVYEVPDVQRESFGVLCDAIASRFDLVPAGPRVEGLEVVFQRYRFELSTVSLEWDHWTGFTVVAEDAVAEPLVESIAASPRETVA